MRSVVFGLLLVGFSAPATAKSVYVMAPVASAEQATKWVEGTPTIINARPLSNVVFAPRGIELPGKPSSFTVVVFNKSEQPITFGPENVTIELSDGQKLSMADPEAIEGKLRRDIKRRKALAALGGAFSAQGANGYTSGTFSYTGTSTGGGMYSGIGTYSGYDPALAAQQQQAAREQANSVASAIDARRAAGEESMQWLMRKSTIEPGQGDGGLFAFEVPKAFAKAAASKPVTIVVTVSGEEHRFFGQLTEAP